MQKVRSKKNWKITSDAFQNLLEWLDEGIDSDGQKYLEMRQKLVSYFDRKNCLSPNELADETLNRIARRIEEEGTIESETPAKYCYITARFVFMEYLRRNEKTDISLDGLPNYKKEKHLTVEDNSSEQNIKEKMLKCLEHCTKKLKPEKREVILDYYFGEQQTKINNRRKIAKKLGITINALSIRACRIRDKLENCVSKCAKEEQ